MRTPDSRNTTTAIPARAWRKSSYSGEANANCVETAGVLLPDVAVRDSKHPETGHLTISPTAWAVFINAVKRGEHDLPA